MMIGLIEIVVEIALGGYRFAWWCASYAANGALEWALTRNY